MSKYTVENRRIEEAKYIIKTGATVRQTAIEFNVSKSTVWNDMTKCLKEIDVGLFYKVLDILELNLKARAERGGEATRVKYFYRERKGE